MTLLVNKLKSLFKSQLQSMADCKMVIVVRTDIPMGKGKIAAQCAHAAVSCCQKVTSTKYQQAFNSWLLLGQPKIILQISNEESILNLAKNAHKAKLPFAVIKDAGRTQLQPGTITVIGIGPAPKEHIDIITSSLKLL